MKLRTHAIRASWRLAIQWTVQGGHLQSRWFVTTEAKGSRSDGGNSQMVRNAER